MASLSSVLNTFADPLPNTYRTGVFFMMPHNPVGIWSIAVTSKVAGHLISAYGLLVFMICGFAWQLVVCLALLFYPTEGCSQKSKTANAESGISDLNTLLQGETKRLLEVRRRNANRYITLITIRNAQSPSFAVIKLLFDHMCNMYTKAKDRSTARYDIAIIVAALAVTVGSSAAGTFVPQQCLKVGTVAPANPGEVYYGMPGTLQTKISNQKSRAPATQRAIGIVSSAQDELQKRVNVHDPEVMDWTGPAGETINRTAYDYNVTGLDLGLQLEYATEFVLSVTGACTIQYGLSVLDQKNYNVYTIFSSEIYIPRFENERPVGGFVALPAHPSLDQILLPNKSYAIIPDTLDRWSYTEGTDPWYKTVPNSLKVDPSDANFTVAINRPVLYCWQQDIWSYQGYSARSASDLDSLRIHGLNLPDVIGGSDGYIAFRMAIPMIADVANSLGASILASSASSMSGNLDASLGSYHDDLTRLIFTSFLVTQNMLRDTVLVTDTAGLKNNATSENGDPRPGTGDFVISSGAVVTLSVKTLIWVPLIWLILQLGRMCISIRTCTHRNSGMASRYTMRSVGLQNVHLYRMLDEEACGRRDDWCERKGQMPYIREASKIGSPTAGTLKCQNALYIAPTVVADDFDRDKYHLRFVGPTEYDSENELKDVSGKHNWSWDGGDGVTMFGKKILPRRRMSVVNGPSNEKQDEAWYRRLWGSIYHRWVAAKAEPDAETEVPRLR